MDKRLSRYTDMSLQEIADQLHVNYYDILVALTKKADEKLNMLRSLDTHHITELYISICDRALQVLKQYLTERMSPVKSYLQELEIKEAKEHDCNTCKDNCRIRHQAYIENLRQSHIEITQLLHELQTKALPLYSNLNYPPLYASLRNNMLLIDIIARELIFVEEAYLLPGIIRLQQKIHVHP